MTILAAVLVFAILVIVHEFGHFIMAKRAGVRVDEFAIGFPPRIWGFKRGETQYSLNLLPLGGYVRMPGENGEVTDEHGNPDTRTFGAQTAGKRALILVAGVTMNMILAIVIYIGLFAVNGKPNYDIPVIASVVAGSPAATAGINGGDRILAINGHRTQDVKNVQDLIAQTIADDKNPVDKDTVPLQITVGHLGQQHTLTVNARRNPPQGQGAIGIGISVLFSAVPIWQTPGLAIVQIGENFTVTGQGIHDVLAGIIKPGEAFSGPVGIVKFTSQAAGETSSYGLTPLLSLMALLSWNLAVVNLLPIPGLDGGRLLILGIEVLRRGKRLAPEREAIINLAGMVFLLSLIAVITVNDISHIVAGK